MFYLYPHLKDELDLEGLRLNYEEIAMIYSAEKLKLYTEIFDNKRVTKLVSILIQNIQA
jgi:hypothetical protein